MASAVADDIMDDSDTHGRLYLVRLVQLHESFRRAEMKALAYLAGIDMEIVSYHDDSPFCIVRLPSDDAAKAFIRRSVLSTGIWSLLAHGPTYPDLRTYLESSPETLSRLAAIRNTSFRFDFDSFQGKRSTTCQRELINSFVYLDLHGKINLKRPETTYTIFEEYAFPGLPVPNPHSSSPSTQPPTPSAQAQAQAQDTKEPRHVYLGTFLARSSREVVMIQDLKQRNYISTTSMDACLALVTANLALADPGKLIYDPFMGTGGFPLACAHFGALVMGSDIDGRSLRGAGKKPGGKGTLKADFTRIGGGGDGVTATATATAAERREYYRTEKSVLGNFGQYGLIERYLDGFVGDLTNTPLRIPGCGSRLVPESDDAASGKRWLDAIVCDPPYGVREGLKTLGCARPGAGLEEVTLPDGQLAHLSPDYVFPKKPYSFDALQSDILDFAVGTLVDGGRLCMWLPTANDETATEAHTGGGGEADPGLDPGPGPDLCASVNDAKTHGNEQKTRISDTRLTNNGRQTTTDVQGENDVPIAADIPMHPGLELISVCTQDFNKWSRSLLTYQRRVGVFTESRRDDRSDARSHPSLSQSMSCTKIDTEARVGREDRSMQADECDRTADTAHMEQPGMRTSKARETADQLNSFRKKYFEGFK